MQAIRNALDTGLTEFCVFLFMMMTVVGTYQITSRYFFNSPSTISEELITYSFTWLSILAASVVFGQRGHLCMSFVYNRFTGRARVFLDIFSEILVLATAILLLVYGGAYMVQMNTTQVTASLGVSMGLMYAVLPIAGVIIAIYCLLNLYDMVRKLGDPNVSEYGKNQDPV